LYVIGYKSTEVKDGSLFGRAVKVVASKFEDGRDISGLVGTIGDDL